MQPTQTDRLEVGHIATFVWNTCEGKPQLGAYYVVEKQSDKNPTNLPTATSEWLKSFMGKTRHTFGQVSAPEENVIDMMLVGIHLPPKEGSFDLEKAVPHWYESHQELWHHKDPAEGSAQNKAA